MTQSFPSSLRARLGSHHSILLALGVEEVREAVQEAPVPGGAPVSFPALLIGFMFSVQNCHGLVTTLTSPTPAPLSGLSAGTVSAGLSPPLTEQRLLREEGHVSRATAHLLPHWPHHVLFVVLKCLLIAAVGPYRAPMLRNYFEGRDPGVFPLTPTLNAGPTVSLAPRLQVHGEDPVAFASPSCLPITKDSFPRLSGWISRADSEQEGLLGWVSEGRRLEQPLLFNRLLRVTGGPASSSRAHPG